MGESLPFVSATKRAILFTTGQGERSEMVTITLMGELQTNEGERSLGCEISGPIPVRQLIRSQGKRLREVFQLLKEKKVMVTVNKRIASEDTQVHDGDHVTLLAHDGMGRSGLTPALY